MAEGPNKPGQKPDSTASLDYALANPYSSNPQVWNTLGNLGRTGLLEGRVSGITHAQYDRQYIQQEQEKKKKDEEFRLAMILATPSFIKWTASVKNYNDCWQSADELAKLFTEHKIILATYTIGEQQFQMPVHGTETGGYYIEDPFTGERITVSAADVEAMRIDPFDNSRHETLDERLAKHPEQKDYFKAKLEQLKKAIRETKPAFEAMQKDYEDMQAQKETGNPGDIITVAEKKIGDETYSFPVQYDREKEAYYFNDFSNPGQKTIINSEAIDEFTNNPLNILRTLEQLFQANPALKKIYEDAPDSAPKKNADFTEKGLKVEAGALSSNFNSKAVIGTAEDTNMDYAGPKTGVLNHHNQMS